MDICKIGTRVQRKSTNSIMYNYMTRHEFPLIYLQPPITGAHENVNPTYLYESCLHIVCDNLSITELPADQVTLRVRLDNESR